MKGIFRVLFLILILPGLLVGCSKEPVREKAENEIRPKELTQEQNDIVKLLTSNQQEILLFDYDTKEEYKSAEVWVETYEDGTLTDCPCSIMSSDDKAKPLHGQLAVQIHRNPNFQWTISMDDGGTIRTGYTSGPTNVNPDASGRAFGPINEPITIEDGKEIILYTSIFSDGGISMYGDQQIYLEQPDRLKDYPYIHIIKCKFEK